MKRPLPTPMTHRPGGGTGGQKSLVQLIKEKGGFTAVTEKNTFFRPIKKPAVPADGPGPIVDTAVDEELAPDANV